MTFAEEYIEVLNQNELNHSDIMKTNDGADAVEFGMTTKVTKVRALAVFRGETVSVRIFSLAQVPEDKFGDALLVCNDLNTEYRFTKFYVDEDNEVTVAADGILSAGTAGSETFDLVATTIATAEKAYPTFMKAIWS